MPEIKIFLLEDYCYDDDNYRHRLGEGISDWEDVSEDDLNYLRSNSYRFSNVIKSPYTIVRKDNTPIQTYITSVKELVEKDKRAEEKRKKEELRKKLEREQKKLQKKEESERQLYERLKAKIEKETS